MSPQEKTFSLLVLYWTVSARTLPRLSSSTPEVLDHAVLHRAEEAHGEQHEVGLEHELGARDRLELLVGAGAVQLLDLAVLALELDRGDGEVAGDAFFLEDEVRIFIGQFGQVSALFSFSGGAGMISIWVTERAPWRFEVPMQSEPVSPPPMTTTCLPLGEDRLDVVQRLVGDAAVLLRQELHGEVDAVELAAGDRQVARLLGAAGQRHGVVLGDAARRW